jgi:hypothetical protein
MYSNHYNAFANFPVDYQKFIQQIYAALFSAAPKAKSILVLQYSSAVKLILKTI